MHQIDYTVIIVNILRYVTRNRDKSASSTAVCNMTLV